MKKNTLAGKTFCITGKLTHARKCYEEMIESLGGKVIGKVSSRCTAVVYGFNDGETEKERKAEELGIPMINEQAFYAMAGMTLEEFRKQERERRIAERQSHETSFAGKWERLKTQAMLAIGKLGNEVVTPTKRTNIYIHYVLSVRMLAARVECITANGVAFTGRKGKIHFLDYGKIEPAQLMAIADCAAKLRDADKNSFCRRYRELWKEHDLSGKEAARMLN